MTRFKIVAVAAAWGLVAVAVLSGPSTSTPPTPGEPDLYCGFENVKVWDISPERGFTLSLSTEHVTQGAHALKVEFPEEAWPSINTKQLTQPVKEFEALTFDVFNPQEETLNFAVRLDDRSRKRVTITRRLTPGMNHVRIPRAEMARRIDTTQLYFVVLFLKQPDKEITLYFDNMRLTSPQAAEQASAPSPAAPAKANASVPTAASAPDAAPTPPPMPPMVTVRPVPPPASSPETSGTLEVPVVQLRGETGAVALVSNGVPFAPGALTSERNVAFLHEHEELAVGTKVLARWPIDQSIRSLLVQFRLPMDRPQESVTMRWGEPRTTNDIELTEVTWEFPEALLSLPAEWLCESQVIGAQVPMFTHDFPSYDSKIMQYYPARRDDRLTGDIRADGYYSTPHVFYQLYVRTGTLDLFLAARREAIAYRDGEILLDGKNRGRHVKYSQPRYLYVEALADDYLLTGDERSRTVAGYMADYIRTHFNPGNAFYPKQATTFWTERYYAALFSGVLTYYEISGDRTYGELAKQYMQNLYKTQQQWPGRGGFIHNLYAHDPEEYARPDEHGGSPFMTGLLLEPIIKYHRLTGSEDAARSIFLALDWLLGEGLAPDGETFRYLTADYYRNENGPPDLNLLIVHALGYGYYLSGDTNTGYLEVGTRAFRRGVEDAYLKKRKHFNQNHRSSGHFLAYIARGAQALSDDTILYASDFEYALDGWSAPFSGTMVEQDRSTAYSGTGSLRVRSTASASNLSSARRFADWSIEGYPRLQFAYKIPPGVPVGMRCKTSYGDWVYLGGTAGQRIDGPEGESGSPLIADNQWHELTIDVAQAIRQVLPGVRGVQEFQFFTHEPAGVESAFWIDGFAIVQ